MSWNPFGNFVEPAAKPQKSEGHTPGKALLAKGMLVHCYDNGQPMMNDDKLPPVHFQFNPTVLEELHTVDWKRTEHPGQVFSAATFAMFGKREFKFELYLYGRELGRYTSPAHDAELQLNALRKFVFPKTMTVEQPDFVSPGRAQLVLGAKVYNGVVLSVRLKHTRFDRKLNTVEATAEIAFDIASVGLYGDIQAAKVFTGFNTYTAQLKDTLAEVKNILSGLK